MKNIRKSRKHQQVMILGFTKPNQISLLIHYKPESAYRVNCTFPAGSDGPPLPETSYWLRLPDLNRMLVKRDKDELAKMKNEAAEEKRK
jgi:hypothetical protein